MRIKYLSTSPSPAHFAGASTAQSHHKGPSAGHESAFVSHLLTQLGGRCFAAAHGVADGMDGAVFAKVLVVSLDVGDEMAELGTAHIPLTYHISPPLSEHGSYPSSSEQRGHRAN